MNLNEISQTPVCMLNAGQLADFFQAMLADYFRNETSQMPSVAPEGRDTQIVMSPEGRAYVRGIKGIQNLFKVSNMTAQRYKKGILKDAVSQYGRNILVDVDKARELFAAAKGSKNAQSTSSL